MKRIISYNVNGIRAALQKGFADWLKIEAPDVLCIQEIKAQPEQIASHLFEELGYHCFWNPAVKKGYSGVGLLCKTKPDNVVWGMGIPEFDHEGRVLRADFGDLTVLSLYIPSGTTGGERQIVKMRFLDALHHFIKQLQVERPNLVLSGDFNICHKAIDINHPERQKNVSGFLPEEREWVSNFLNDGFIDSFRQFNQQPNQYSWWSYRAGARANNMGWRIDYHLVSSGLESKLIHADILSSIVHSDHCPVTVSLNVD